MKRELKFIFLTITCVMVMCMAFSVSAFAASGAPQVMMNGDYLKFTDATPTNVNGRIMVPYRAMFEDLGATVDFNTTTQEITGKTDDVSLVMKNGDKNINLKYADGTTKTVTMDVAPYINNSGRTLVPTRFVSEVLGYTVGWDSSTDTVIIIDTEDIVMDANKDFSTLMKMQNTDLALDKTYDVTGDFNGTMAMDLSSFVEGTSDASLAANIDIKGNVGGLVKGSDADLNMDMATTVDGETTSTAIEMKLDSTNGKILMKMDMNGTGTPQWYSLDLFSIYSDMGIDLKSVIQAAATGDYDLSSILSDSFSASADSYTINSYNEFVGAYAMIKEMLGNGAFTKANNTYTANINADSIVKGVESAYGSAVANEVKKELDDSKLSGVISFTTDGNNDKVIAYKVKLDFEMDGMAMGIDCNYEKQAAKMTMNIDLGKMMNLDFDMNFAFKESSKAIDVKAPSGVTVTPLDSLISSMQ